MIINIYITLMPVILAGICNMIFVKTSLYKRLYSPIDGGICLKDGYRLFGENKSWGGFFSMVFFSMCIQVWGLLCHSKSYMQMSNYLYVYNKNTVGFNIFIGSLFGLAYMICELPNSFIKRRFNIRPGKTEKGIRGFFFLLDQFDSLFGVIFILALVYPMDIVTYCFFVCLGGMTHVVINLILYGLKIRKNI